MTKAEAYEKAWRLGWKSGDFSLVDQIYHPDYSLWTTGLVSRQILKMTKSLLQHLLSQ